MRGPRIKTSRSHHIIAHQIGFSGSGVRVKTIICSNVRMKKSRKISLNPTCLITNFAKNICFLLSTTVIQIHHTFMKKSHKISLIPQVLPIWLKTPHFLFSTTVIQAHHTLIRMGAFKNALW